ncbi:MAG: hypothetical protein ACK4RF_01685 [Cyclobacteriaceae bacterium]
MEKLKPTIRTGCFLAIALIVSLLPGNAQDSSSYTVRLKKSERIYLAAYDDTTRALATLFLVKRHKIIGPPSPTDFERYTTGFNMEAMWIAFGVSSAVFVAGMFMVNQNTDTVGDDGMIAVIPLIGGMCMLSTGINLAVQYILLSPYTVRRYFKLLDTYTSGGQLPRSYTKRMAKYLR